MSGKLNDTGNAAAARVTIRKNYPRQVHHALPNIDLVNWNGQRFHDDLRRRQGGRPWEIPRVEGPVGAVCSPGLCGFPVRSPHAWGTAVARSDQAVGTRTATPA